MRGIVLAVATIGFGVFLSGGTTIQASSYTISITDDRIIPNAITVAANQKTHLTIHNVGRKTHNFVIPDFYIFTPNLRSQQGTTVEFVPEKKGAFTYYSDAGGVPEPGLSGTFRVK